MRIVIEFSDLLNNSLFVNVGIFQFSDSSIPIKNGRDRPNPNLAGFALSLAGACVPEDWLRCYGCRPMLMETWVDGRRFKGTCYRAANWVHIGETTGRGRMDRTNTRQGMADALSAGHLIFTLKRKKTNEKKYHR